MADDSGSKASPAYNLPSTPTAAAAQGFALGAAKWLCLAGLCSVAGNLLSPVYRSLTIQFKVYLHISAATLGGYVEADRRFRVFEAQRRVGWVRERNNRQRQQQVALYRESLEQGQQRGQREHDQGNG